MGRICGLYLLFACRTESRCTLWIRLLEADPARQRLSRGFSTPNLAHPALCLRLPCIVDIAYDMHLNAQNVKVL